MKKKRSRIGKNNPNWKGGISGFKKSSDVLKLSEFGQDVIRDKLLDQYVKDPSTGCWLWLGSTWPSGRAMLSLGGRGHTAAVLCYLLLKGPTNGKHVLHTCDNLLCICPKHLWLGTPADNSADMVKKKRSATGDRNGSRLHPEKLMRGDAHLNRIHPERVQGENNGRAQLTNKQVRRIRRMYKPYVNNHDPSNAKELAIKFGVSKNIISLIGKGITWKSV